MNENGEHTNKIEGHWRHAKLLMPSFGARKNLFASILDQMDTEIGKSYIGDIFDGLLETNIKCAKDASKGLRSQTRLHFIF